MAKEAKIISSVIQLLGEWAELFPYDFRDERMMAHVRTITQKCVSVEPPVKNQDCVFLQKYSRLCINKEINGDNWSI